MHRLAALYDIHGNLPALEAVLDDIRAIGVAQIIVGGDVVPGPMPRETLECLSNVDLPVQFIRGNGELAVLGDLRGVPEQFHGDIRWNAEQLTRDDLDSLGQWPRTLVSTIQGIGRVLFCHATARNENEVFTRDSSDERVRALFAGVDADLIVCGHTHMQFDRTVSGLRIVNAGSVGMPFGEAGAYWLLLTPEIELRRTSYDLENAAQRIRGSSYPGAEQFASRHVLQPPNEAAMLEAFRRAEPQ